MSDDNRLPWFHCYPGKLLGALAGMDPDRGYVYVIVLLRIYEVSGPCMDSIDVLARRCGMRKARCERALNWLLNDTDPPKLRRLGKGLMNPMAALALARRDRIISDPGNLENRPVQTHGQKPQANQSKGGGGTPPTTPTDLDRDSDKDRTSPLSGGGAAASKAKRIVGTVLPVDWWPDDELFQYGIKLGLTREQVEKAATKMKGWAKSEAHRAIVKKASWKATFENWLRRDAERLPPKSSGGGRSMMDIARGRKKTDEEPDR